jgi:gas vesicle protein
MRSKLMYSFLIGLSAGTLLGVLFAPKAGGSTRNYLGSVATGSVDYVKRQTDEIRESTLDMVDRGKDVLHRQVEKLATAQNNGVEVYQR